MQKPNANAARPARRVDRSTDAAGSKRGASAVSHRPSVWNSLWRSYMRHHQTVAKDSLWRMLSAPLPSIMTITVIAIAVALPFGLLIVMDNARSVLQGWDGKVQMSVFLQDSHQNQGELLAQRWPQRDDIKSAQFLSKDEALNEYREMMGFDPVLGLLDNNPLPATIVLIPTSTDSSQLEALRSELQQTPGVEFVQLDMAWAQRLQAMLQFGERMVMALLITLSAAVIFVVLNTIRLMISSRRDEIVVTKLVGATNAFVRRPFLYTGLWYGVVGGIVALLLLYIVFTWVEGPLQALLALYQSEFEPVGLSWTRLLEIVGASVALAWAGSWLAVSRYLHGSALKGTL